MLRSVTCLSITEENTYCHSNLFGITKKENQYVDAAATLILTKDPGPKILHGATGGRGRGERGGGGR